MYVPQMYVHTKQSTMYAMAKDHFINIQAVTILFTMDIGSWIWLTNKLWTFAKAEICLLHSFRLESNMLLPVHFQKSDLSNAVKQRY